MCISKVHGSIRKPWAHSHLRKGWPTRPKPGPDFWRPRRERFDLLSEVGKAFGVPISPSEGAAQYTKRLRGQLERNAHADHRSILIVDQFEELSEENLGALGSLVELRNSTGPMLSVILFARPHARNKMNEPRFAALAQQYTRARTIAPLHLAETNAYIEHRLTIAGSADLGMFDEGAVILIHAASKGNPRLINQLCHATLLTAYRAEARGVSDRFEDRLGAAPDEANPPE